MKKKSHILLVEDEENLARVLLFNLEEEGYRVTWARDGRTGLESFDGRTIDLVILDLMLPYIDGFAVAETIRRQSAQIPILMLTARTGSDDRIRGLESGADDYLTKPFRMRELMARVKAMLRRVRLIREDAEARSTAFESSSGGKLASGNLEVNMTRREVLIDGKALALKPKEYELLHFLAVHRGQVLTRETILEKVWGWDFIGDSRTVDVHIRWLREKIEKKPAEPTRIVTVRGAGYRFEG